MAIERDYLSPTDTEDATETKFIDRLLEGWAKWARTDAINLGPTPVGFIWRIPSILVIGHEIIISDDGFVLVDQSVARLPQRLRGIVIVEYTRGGPTESKHRALGLNRLAYRQRLHAAQWTLYASLVPVVDGWRQEAV